MSNVTHFTSGDYIVIKTPQGQYSFLGTDRLEIQKHLSELQREIRLAQRKIAALTLFLGGKSESNPEALHN